MVVQCTIVLFATVLGDGKGFFYQHLLRIVMEKVGDGGFAIGVVGHTLFMLALLLLLTLVLTLTFSYSASLLSSFLCYLFSSDSEQFKATQQTGADSWLVCKR